MQWLPIQVRKLLQKPNKQDIIRKIALTLPSSLFLLGSKSAGVGFGACINLINFCCIQWVSEMFADILWFYFFLYNDVYMYVSYNTYI